MLRSAKWLIDFVITAYFGESGFVVPSTAAPLRRRRWTTVFAHALYPAGAEPGVRLKVELQARAGTSA